MIVPHGASLLLAVYMRAIRTQNRPKCHVSSKQRTTVHHLFTFHSRVDIDITSYYNAFSYSKSVHIKARIMMRLFEVFVTIMTDYSEHCRWT